jgi:hypothetical protein
MTDPYNRAFTFTHDWAGGATLAHTSSGLSVYFQPGDDVATADARFDRLVGECGYSGQTALAMLWSDYEHVATLEA